MAIAASKFLTGRVLLSVVSAILGCTLLATLFQPQGSALVRRAADQFAMPHNKNGPGLVRDDSLERVLLGEKQRHNTDAVLYSFRPNDEEDEINLQFFVDHALHDKADFYLIINGHRTQVEFPDRPNIYVTRRHDDCYDLGSIGAVLAQNDNEVMDKYERFILTSSKSRGPFFPAWATHTGQACWTQHLFGALNAKTKLVGTTADCSTLDHPKHLQYTALATDREGLEMIMPSLLCYGSEGEAKLRGELIMTQLIRGAGYEALPLYTNGYNRTRADGPRASADDGRPDEAADEDEEEEKEDERRNNDKDQDERKDNDKNKDERKEDDKNKDERKEDDKNQGRRKDKTVVNKADAKDGFKDREKDKEAKQDQQDKKNKRNRLEPRKQGQFGADESDNDAFWRLCTHGDAFASMDDGGLDAHPYDAMFVRLDLDGLYSTRTAEAMDKLGEWADKSYFSSYAQCK